MTGLGRPPRTARSLQNKEQLARSHRTRPPPADTRRACCHVLSSFQRTGLARPPVIGLSAAARRTFQTYQPATPVSSLNSGHPRDCRADPPQSFVLRRESTLESLLTKQGGPSGRRVASHANS